MTLGVRVWRKACVTASVRSNITFYFVRDEDGSI
jgi:hypothetical protein